jgi:hypothetical protein
MTALFPRSIRGPLMVCVGGILGLALTGCGAPRVNEVYRLTVAEPWPEAAAEPSSLTAAQADLRRLALSVHEQRGRGRAGAAGGQQDSLVLAPMALQPSTLHGCTPGQFAEFTIRSAGQAPKPGSPTLLAGLVTDRRW